ncbi:hypothetical protein XCM_22130 (plasmid) [Xanthomonas citri pv. mangiferaeindicae]|nr:hypothetical protein XCM_22130 [Xanthomonas citri pv. mangiferaeindicae]
MSKNDADKFLRAKISCSSSASMSSILASLWKV